MKYLYLFVPVGDTMKPLLHIVGGFDIDVSWDKQRGRLPYSFGDLVRIKIYDPKEQEDVDRDTRAWRLAFTATSVEFTSNTLYVTGFAHEPFWPDFHYFECEEGHQPWEHDGVCQGEEFVYEGPVELRFGDATEGSDEFILAKDLFTKREE